MMNENAYQQGDVIGGKYEVRKILEKGGFGVVYLAYDRELQNLVALKTFRDEFLSDTKARSAFKKESLLWVNLEEHPHILAARWVSEVSGRLFVSMDFIDPDAQGRVSLHDHLAAASGPLDINQTLGWAIQFCFGMEHAQAHGLKCHRDIKPNNILIASDWTLKIADFGLAAAAAIAWDKSNSPSMVAGKGDVDFGFSMLRTEGRMRCGTPGYMPPEVFRCEPADTRSDIYSFGLVIWQMIVGSRLPPFVVARSSDIEAYLLGVYRNQMSERLPPVQHPLTPMVKKCLRAKPSERYGDFRELREELTSVWLERTGTEFPIPEIIEMAGFWNNKGGALAALGQHEEAIKCYDKALIDDSQDLAAWVNKGVALNRLGRHEESIMCYVKALAIDSRHAGAWNNLGNAHDVLGRHDEAIACYDVALAADAQNADAWNNKSYTLISLGRHAEAIQCLEKALALDPRHACAWTTKAIALRSLGRNDEAIACCDKALEIDPHYAAAWGNKGNALQEMGRHEEAIKCFARHT